MKFTIERCLSGYIVWIGYPSSIYNQTHSHEVIHAFTHKEHVFTFLRKALEFDKESGLAREQK